MTRFPLAKQTGLEGRTGVPGRIWRLERARGGKDGLCEAGLGRKDGHLLWSGYAG